MESTANDAVYELAEDYLRDYRSGTAPSVEEFAKSHPELKTEILEVFPAMLMAEALKPDAPVVPDVPSHIGRYQVGRELGRGGMGIVYAARHPDLDNEVAIKLLPYTRLRSPEVLQRFHAEAKACASMDHSNIVPVYDFGTEEGFAYLVMRRVRGISLDRLIDQLSDHTEPSGKGIEMDWGYVGRIAAQVADGLHYAHEQGVIHRDIKPANLLIQRDGKAWVTDFGLAKVLESQLDVSLTGDLVGTPRYMAPERLRGVYGPASDVYGLGISIYELVTGRKAWPNLDKGQFLSDQFKLTLPDVLELNPAVPPGLAQIITKACAFNAEDRYQTAGELHFVVNRFVHGNPVADRRRSNSARQRWRRKKYLTAAAISATFAAVGGGYGVYRYGQQDGVDRLLQDPQAVAETLNYEETRAKVAEQLPELIHTVVVQNDPKIREIIGDVVDRAVDVSLEGESDENKKLVRDSITPLRDAFVKDGLLSDGFARAIATHPNDAHHRFARLPQLIQRSKLTDEEKKFSMRVFTTFHVNAARQLLTPDAIQRAMNRFLSEIDTARDSDAVPDDNLRHFIVFLTRELEAGGVEVKPPTPKRSRVTDTQRAELTKAVKEVLEDPRVPELLEQLQQELKKR